MIFKSSLIKNFKNLKVSLKVFNIILIRLKLLINPLGYEQFLRRLPEKSRILDIGCGNNSPQKVKKILPKCHYIGIDIMDYNQSSQRLADEYYLVDRNDFIKCINQQSNIDVVISYHNIEHVDNRIACLKAILNSLRQGGIIYLVTPSEKSVNFPSREGTLNYYDDKTHKSNPVSFKWLKDEILSSNFTIIKSIREYKPLIFYLIGFLKELQSPKLATFYSWCYYGFETIIIAKKKKGINICLKR